MATRRGGNSIVAASPAPDRGVFLRDVCARASAARAYEASPGFDESESWNFKTFRPSLLA